MSEGLVHIRKLRLMKLREDEEHWALGPEPHCQERGRERRLEGPEKAGRVDQGQGGRQKAIRKGRSSRRKRKKDQNREQVVKGQPFESMRTAVNRYVQNGDCKAQA